jgi:cation:H+ antiporter
VNDAPSAGDSEAPSHQYHSIRDSIGAGRKELTLALLLIGVYFYFRFTGQSLSVVILLGFLMGAWLAFRPSEWAVEGVESIAGHLRFTAYIAGMLTSLASNLPEAVISFFAAFEGYVTGNAELLDIAILSVLVAAGFNMLLLGITIVISTRKEGEMRVPEEVIKKDSVLIRWTIVALLSMFALGIIGLAVSEIPSGTVPGRDLKFPPWAALMLFLSYLIYAGVLVRDRDSEKDVIEEPSQSKRSAATLWTIGIVGIFFAGEMLTESVNLLLETQRHVVSAVGDPVTIAALILGAAGALPEHGIAVLAAMKGKIGLAIGNLVGGVLQILLLVMGGIGMFVLIPLDIYVLFQIVVIAGSLWFLKRAITDDEQLDTFEGMMIILLQVYVFILMLTGIPIIYAGG